ncbi:MAG: hypothetical protein II832_03425 [Synergistaceae bacterium]|nr:hypothetical protein [Synergistaceae bacterium]
MNSNNNTNNLPVSFNYEGKQVRSVKIDGEVWLVAKDVCEVLEIADHRSAVQALDDDEKRGWEIATPSNGGYSTVNVINEAGLYKLTFRSRKPKAKEFTRWVTHEVLPEIMHTGKYVHPALMEDKPAPIPRDIKVYLSKANFSAQERIIDRAVEAYYLVKNNDPNADKECQKVLALDLAFRKRTGYSALEAAGINIECDTSGKISHYWNLMTIDWVSHFKVAFKDSRLVIPDPYSEEHALPDE